MAACGAYHSVAVTSEGELFSWECGEHGKLAAPGGCAFDGARVLVAACGREHTALTTSDGSLYTFGKGGEGRLGHGDAQDRFYPTVLGPDKFFGSPVLMVSCGLRHTLAVTARAQVFSWGYGGEGRLGHGDSEDRLVPRPIPTKCLGGAVALVAAGWEHSVAVTEEGDVFTWGYGGVGRLGHSDTSNRWLPTKVAAEHFGTHRHERIVMVAAGKAHTAAVGEGGSLFTWGCGIDGRLGLGDRSNRSAPSRVELGGSPVRMVSCGNLHTLAVTEDGLLFSWGDGRGTDNRLGLGRSCGLVLAPVRVQGALSGLSVVLAAAGFSHSLAVTQDGALFGWGRGCGLAQASGHEGLAEPVRFPRSMLQTTQSARGRIGRCCGIPPAKALAFAMVSHCRLGAESVFGTNLLDDLVCQIVQVDDPWPEGPAGSHPSILRLLGGWAPLAHGAAGSRRSTRLACAGSAVDTTRDERPRNTCI